MFQNINILLNINIRYTFCGKFIFEYQLYVSWRWRQHDDVAYTLNTVGYCSILPSSILSNSMNKFNKRTF